MSNIRDVIKDALVDFIQRGADSTASDVLKVYEEIEHALLAGQVSYGAEDRYFVKIIYRRDDYTTSTFCYTGTFGELIREIVEYYEDSGLD